jgi:hypothetical protein
MRMELRFAHLKQETPVPGVTVGGIIAALLVSLSPLLWLLNACSNQLANGLRAAYVIVLIGSPTIDRAARSM